eukprot:462191-Prymnesium_polylepis.1
MIQPGYMQTWEMHNMHMLTVNRTDPLDLPGPRGIRDTASAAARAPPPAAALWLWCAQSWINAP